MLKQSFRITLSLLLGVYSLSSAAKAPGKLFEVTATGTPTPLSITVCLNAKGPLSCQNYQVTGTTLSIKTTIPGRSYPSAGMKINTPGYVPKGCTPSGSGYCLFTASNTTATTIQATQNNPPTINIPVLSAVGSLGLPNASSILLGTSLLTSSGTWNAVGGISQALGAVSCSANGVCLASASNKAKLKQDFAASTQAALYISTDSGSTWAAVANVPNTMDFTSTSCASTTGNNALCVAVGRNLTNDSTALYYTTDKGANWSSVITGVTSGYFRSVNCVSISNDVACMAVGTDNDNNVGIAWYYEGSSWSNTNYPDKGIDSTDCYVTNPSEVHCAAVNNNNQVYEYSDQTASWAQGTGTITPTIQLRVVSCTDDGGICAAVGFDSDNSAPALYTKTANDWVAIDVGSDEGAFSDVSCSGSGSNSFCAAVVDTGVLWESTDGVNWVVADYDTPPGDTYFNTINCSYSGSAFNCITGGEARNSDGAILYNRDTSGKWIYVTKMQQYTGRFLGSTCFGTGTSARCIAVGSLASQRYPLLSTSVDRGLNWTVTHLQQPPGTFNTTSCTGSGANTVCLAGGVKTPITSLAYISLGGKAWSPINSLNDMTQKRMMVSSCTGSGNSAVCAIGGDDGGRSVKHATPAFAYLSQNGGSSWTEVSFSSPIRGGITALSCTGAGNQALCAALGGDSVFVSNPVSPVNWSVISSGTLDRLDSLSCTGSGATAVCMAMGSDFTNTGYSVSTDGGAHWSSGTFAGTDTFGTSVSCYGSQATAFCLASAGPQLYYWTAATGWKLTLDSPGTIEFASVSCSTDFSLCAAVGRQEASPIVYQSKNKGLSWSQVNVSGINVPFFSVNCTGTGNTAMCSAVTGGQRKKFVNPDSSLPALIYMTRNGGQSWSAVPGDTSLGSFTSVSAGQ